MDTSKYAVYSIAFVFSYQEVISVCLFDGFITKIPALVGS